MITTSGELHYNCCNIHFLGNIHTMGPGYYIWSFMYHRNVPTVVTTRDKKERVGTDGNRTGFLART